uniref:ZP domain-containing protein n=1 Tax=Rhabditophanes sp. KR3021 TaxID=114890 RepID=A0AC35UB67_9BILA
MLSSLFGRKSKKSTNKENNRSVVQESYNQNTRSKNNKPDDYDHLEYEQYKDNIIYPSYGYSKATAAKRHFGPKSCPGIIEKEDDRKPVKKERYRPTREHYEESILRNSKNRKDNVSMVYRNSVSHSSYNHESRKSVNSRNGTHTTEYDSAIASSMSSFPPNAKFANRNSRRNTSIYDSSECSDDSGSDYSSSYERKNIPTKSKHTVNLERELSTRKSESQYYKNKYIQWKDKAKTYFKELENSNNNLTELRDVWFELKNINTMNQEKMVHMEMKIHELNFQLTRQTTGEQFYRNENFPNFVEHKNEGMVNIVNGSVLNMSARQNETTQLDNLFDNTNTPNSFNNFEKSNSKNSTPKLNQSLDAVETTRDFLETSNTEYISPVCTFAPLRLQPILEESTKNNVAPLASVENFEEGSIMTENNFEGEQEIIKFVPSPLRRSLSDGDLTRLDQFNLENGMMPKIGAIKSLTKSKYIESTDEERRNQNIEIFQKRIKKIGDRIKFVAPRKVASKVLFSRFGTHERQAMDKFIFLHEENTDRSVISMKLIIILAFFLIEQLCAYEENSVIGVPSVLCEENNVALDVITAKPFEGNIFVKGHAKDKTCRQSYSSNGTSIYQLGLGDCGMQRLRTANPRGINFAVTIIVSFHPAGFITKNDRAFRIRCFYMEPDETVTQSIEVSALQTTELNDEMVMPECTYSVRKNSVDGAIMTFGKVGDTAFHVWECKGRDVGMLIKKCFVTDGDGEDHAVVDFDGCSTDNFLLSEVTYDSSLMRAYATSTVFKYADSNQLYFTCQIRLCQKQLNMCDGVTPPVCGGNQEIVEGEKVDKKEIGKLLNNSTKENLTTEQNADGEDILVLKSTKNKRELSKKKQDSQLIAEDPAFVIDVASAEMLILDREQSMQLKSPDSVCLSKVFLSVIPIIIAILICLTATVTLFASNLYNKRRIRNGVCA